MLNNDVLKKLRFILDYNDQQMLEIFALADTEVTRSQLSNWLKKEEDPAYASCKDIDLAVFLNGLINSKRGKKDGEAAAPEKTLSNNQAFRKIIIAYELKSEDVVEVLKLADFSMGKTELSAFFRKPGHKHYRECKAQVLRNFLMGLQIKERGNL
jgi:uncharacterized protein YehS (DUF1456 family)